MKKVLVLAALFAFSHTLVGCSVFSREALDRWNPPICSNPRIDCTCTDAKRGIGCLTTTSAWDQWTGTPMPSPIFGGGAFMGGPPPLVPLAP